MSLSSSSSETRPTCARHTWACRVRPSGSGTVMTDGRAVGLAQQLERQAVRVERGVVLELPAVGRQALREVAGAVEQPDADQRDAEVGGGLEVVTGQDAEAAGVLRQHLGDAELGGEVGDARRRLGARATGTSAASSRYSSRSSTASCRRRTNRRSLASCGQPLGRHLAEHLDRVAAAALPQRRVQGLEEVPRLGVPGPAEVHHQLGQGRQRLGESRTDGESTECSHRARLTSTAPSTARRSERTRQSPWHQRAHTGEPTIGCRRGPVAGAEVLARARPR